MPVAQFQNIENIRLPAKPLHLAIGMFDGIHLGHRAVIDMAIQSARRSGGLAGVLTFAPHPTVLLRPDNPTRLICNPGTKARLLAETGVDFVATQQFTPGFAQVEAEDFIPLLLRHLPRLNTIYVGENWRFGRARRGDMTMLVAATKPRGLTVMSVSRVNENGEPISSTRIRACLEDGEIEAANIMLGYSYFAEGVVMPGKALGRDLGYPTLNIPWEPGLRPRFGVYAVEVSGEKASGKYRAVANYGLRPTVENSTQPRVEAHLLGPCPFTGGDQVRIDWLRFIRPEMKFANVNELTAQIAKDRAEAEAFFDLA
ncbi:riboflavin kinase/FMN adenylyltransferase [Ereboglobus sp. PH5-5]|uniref:riboflavin biosynthesis protein RibF n=1 Tax=Ereboglobus sp. PH5-5 TaxID=2940529 RepID=UPI0024076D30|nr:riboflavin biosynthesis protein RibF [Ereboglobus sp. PH5-5]MDF9831880.1 riboflavin kinase/FMN adenylyltransferase [Ereboglobus sp. PH5-5]